MSCQSEWKDKLRPFTQSIHPSVYLSLQPPIYQIKKWTENLDVHIDDLKDIEMADHIERSIHEWMERQTEKY